MAHALLPGNTCRVDFPTLQSKVDIWLPAMQAICRLHGIPSDALMRIDEGTNVIFGAGTSHILKLFPPFWRRLARSESAVLEYVHGKLGVATPEVLAQGELEGWPYLVTTRLSGVSLRGVWDRMDERNRHRIAAQLGEMMAQLHALPAGGLDLPASDWPSLVQDRIATCVARRREQGLDESWLRQIQPFLEEAAPLYPPDFTPSIVTGDVHQYHLLVSGDGDSWTLAGYLDFDDATIGFHEYDLAAPGVFMMAHHPELLRTMLLAYGYPRTALDDALARRLMAFTLLHRYRDLNWVLDEYVRDASCTTLEELTRVFYGLG
jgi:hygromycin-B 7''-O-kinase